MLRVTEGGDVDVVAALDGPPRSHALLLHLATLGQPDESRALRGAKVETVTVDVPAPPAG